MGTYLKIPKNKERKANLKAWFEKWKPFYNDFGDKHTFEDVFGDKLKDGTINFKIAGGVGDNFREFYPKEAIQEIKNLIVKFGGDPKEE